MTASRAFKRLSFGGFEGITIRRRLQAINDRFPHNDDAAFPNLGRLYDDLLELSRIDTPQVQRQALSLILGQIACKQTRHLLQALVKCPPLEITTLAKTLTLCMDPDWTGLEDIGRHLEHSQLQETYRSLVHSSAGDEHPATPILHFMTQLARLSPAHSEALIGAGLMDVLLSIYLRCNIATNAALFDTCTSALSAVAMYPDAFKLLCKHPVHLLWPRRALLPLDWVVATQIKGRREAWTGLGSRYCKLRLDRIRDSASFARELTGSPVNSLISVEGNALFNTTTYLFDNLVDLIEFTRSSVYEGELFNQAFELLQTYVWHDKPEAPGNPTISHVDAVETLYSRVLQETNSTGPSLKLFLSSLNRASSSEPIPLTRHMSNTLEGFLSSRPKRSSPTKFPRYLEGILAVPLSIVRDELGGLSFIRKPPNDNYAPLQFLYLPLTDPNEPLPFCIESSGEPQELQPVRASSPITEEQVDNVPTLPLPHRNALQGNYSIPSAASSRWSISTVDSRSPLVDGQKKTGKETREEMLAKREAAAKAQREKARAMVLKRSRILGVGADGQLGATALPSWANWEGLGT